MIQYSIIIPVFNAAPILEELIQNIRQALTHIIHPIELVLVDDGSSDESWHILQELHQQYDNIHIIKLTKNYGQPAATLCGIAYAKGQYFITFDDDLQYDAADIPLLMDYYHQHEQEYLVVYGKPIQKKQNWLNRKAANLVGWYQFQVVLGQEKRTNLSTSFRIFSRDISTRITAKYLVDIDSCINWYIPETKVGFFPVKHRKRKYGKSGYTFWKKASIVFNYHLYFFSPLHLFFILGTLLGIYGAFSYLLFLLNVNEGIAISWHFPFFYILCTALVFLGIGILGSYAAKIYLLSLGKKPYLIEKQQVPKQ